MFKRKVATCCTPPNNACARAVAARCCAGHNRALRRLQVFAETDATHVLSLGEAETVTLSVRTSAPRPVRLLLRQVWPSLIDETASERAGLVRPGELLRFDSSGAEARAYAMYMRRSREARRALFRRLKMDFMHLSTDEPYVAKLVAFFRSRQLRIRH